jgi:hypothetical protein
MTLISRNGHAVAEIAEGEAQDIASFVAHSVGRGATVVIGHLNVVMDVTLVTNRTIDHTPILLSCMQCNGPSTIPPLLHYAVD